MKTNKKRKQSEFREVINAVKYMTKNLNDVENPFTIKFSTIIIINIFFK